VLGGAVVVGASVDVGASVVVVVPWASHVARSAVALLVGCSSLSSKEVLV
jgi:hypothetical protein